MAAPQWAIAIEHSALGAWMRGAEFAYPIVNVLHLLGLTLLIGPMLLLDLRLLGFARHFPLVESSAVLTRFSVLGLAILLPTGVLLFTADAGPLTQNPVLLTKLALITVALLNAVAFRLIWQGHLVHWDQQPPIFGRAQAVLSMGAWLIAGALGRWIAYS
ncbi:MAG: DUF6644 family protein [Povalibacter sp.]